MHQSLLEVELGTYVLLRVYVLGYCIRWGKGLFESIAV